MPHCITTVFLGLAIFFSTGCGFHLRGSTAQVPNDFQTIVLETTDPYGPLVRAIHAQLRLSNIKVVETNYTLHHDTNQTQAVKTPPSLRLGDTYESQNTVSLFADGKTAEYQLVLTLNAQILINGHDLYPLNVRVFRSFFDNSLTALAKDTEQEIIRQEMREQAAQQLIRKLLSVQPSDIKRNDQAQHNLSNMPHTQSASDFSLEQHQPSPTLETP